MCRGTGAAGCREAMLIQPMDRPRWNTVPARESTQLQ